MHEFSIAVDIVDIATSSATKEEATVVKEIEIEVGQLSGSCDGGPGVFPGGCGRRDHP